MVKIKDDPKVVAVMPVWGRPAVLRIVLKMIPSWVTAIVFVASPEDRFFSDILDVIKDYEGRRSLVLHINKPLATKLNYGVKCSLELYEYDYLMNIGSDDVIQPNMLNAYRKELIKEGYKQWPTDVMFGCNAADWVSFQHNKAYRIKYYDIPDVIKIIIGAGRLTSRDIVERCGGNMNNPMRNGGLDTDSQMMVQNTYKSKTMRFNLEGYVLDIKTNTNINKFESLQGANLMMDEITLKQVRDRYGIYMEGVE